MGSNLSSKLTRTGQEGCSVTELGDRGHMLRAQEGVRSPAHDLPTLLVCGQVGAGFTWMCRVYRGQRRVCAPG